MLLVHTRLDRSPIEGIGLFAMERIDKGAVVWEFSSAVDRVLKWADVLSLAPPAREQIQKYAYLDNRTGELILCGDDARFFNHTDAPNVLDDPADPYRCLAGRDILPGEELLCDYREFDAAVTSKLPSLDVSSRDGRSARGLQLDPS